MGVNSLPKTVTRQRRGCDLNPGLLCLSPARQSLGYRATVRSLLTHSLEGTLPHHSSTDMHRLLWKKQCALPHTETANLWKRLKMQREEPLTYRIHTGGKTDFLILNKIKKVEQYKANNDQNYHFLLWPRKNSQRHIKTCMYLTVAEHSTYTEITDTMHTVQLCDPRWSINTNTTILCLLVTFH